MIYFAEASYENKKFIKIGFSDKPKKRLQSLQASCPMKIKLLGVRIGDRRDEKILHDAFRHCRVHGEWYHPHQDLIDTIKVSNSYSS